MTLVLGVVGVVGVVGVMGVADTGHRGRGVLSVPHRLLLLDGLLDGLLHKPPRLARRPARTTGQAGRGDDQHGEGKGGAGAAGH